MEEKNLTPEQIKEKAMENIREVASKEATQVVNETLKGVDEKINVLSTKEEVEKMKEELEQKMNKQKAEIEAKVNQVKQTKRMEKKGMSFSEFIAKTIEDNIEAVKNYRGGDITLVMKDATPAGDMSWTNIDNPAPFTQEVRGDVIYQPHNKVWISEHLTQGQSSNGGSILYPVDGDQVGDVAVWATGNKEQVEFNLDDAAAFHKTIAGRVIVRRDMLDDIPFLISYIQTKLYNSLRNGENYVILNGTSDSNPIEGIYNKATAYDGDLTDPIGMVMDALYGQIGGDTSDNYVGNKLFIHPRDVSVIALNKADGSGEYDLPAGAVTFVNGKLVIGGVEVIPTSAITKGKFLAIDNTAVMFVRRMAPELRIFDGGKTLASANQVMIRIEERFTQLIFNKKALVKGTLKAYAG